MLNLLVQLNEVQTNSRHKLEVKGANIVLKKAYVHLSKRAGEWTDEEVTPI